MNSCKAVWKALRTWVGGVNLNCPFSSNPLHWSKRFKLSDRALSVTKKIVNFNNERYFTFSFQEILLVRNDEGKTWHSLQTFIGRWDQIIDFRFLHWNVIGSEAAHHVNYKCELFKLKYNVKYYLFFFYLWVDIFDGMSYGFNWVNQSRCGFRVDHCYMSGYFKNNKTLMSKKRVKNCPCSLEESWIHLHSSPPRCPCIWELCGSSSK